MIKKVRAAADAMRNTPPLRMLVNPRSFSVKSEKIVSDGNWGRNGPIIEFWGDNQDKISASGSLAGFFAMDVNNAAGPGLTRHARNFSQAYQNFISLYLLYRNNGGLYLEDSGGTEKTLNLSLLGSIYIYYDSILYIGSFDSFTFGEEDTKPFVSEYSFEFTVRASFILDEPTDPNTDPRIQATLRSNEGDNGLFPTVPVQEPAGVFDDFFEGTIFAPDEG